MQIKTNNFAKSILCTGATVAAVLAFTVLPANAALVTFANYTIVGGGNVFQFTRDAANLTNSNFGLITASQQINFNYSVSNAYDTARGTAVGTNIAATLTVSAVVNGPTSGSGTNASPYSQDFKSFNITVTANTPEGGQTNLLTVSSSTANLNGKFRNATLLGSTVAGDTVNFASSFLTFNNSVDRTFSFDLSSIDTAGPPTNLQKNTNGTPGDPSDDYLDTFTAAGTGQFAADPQPGNPYDFPEPGTFALLGMGLIPCAVRVRRTLRKKQA